MALKYALFTHCTYLPLQTAMFFTDFAHDGSSHSIVCVESPRSLIMKEQAENPNVAAHKDRHRH